MLFSGPLWFVLKCCLFVYVQMWLRWTLPRVRIDQVLYACVQVLLPLNMLVLLLAAVWELLLRQSSIFASAAWVISLLLSIGAALLTLSFVGVAVSGRMRRAVLVGPMGVERMMHGS